MNLKLLPEDTAVRLSPAETASRHDQNRPAEAIRDYASANMALSLYFANSPRRR